MFGAMQRVISGDNMDNQEGEQQQQLPSPPGENNDVMDTTATTCNIYVPSQSSTDSMPVPPSHSRNIDAAIVEDDDMDVDNSTTGSSLSDVSAAKDHHHRHLNQQQHYEQQEDDGDFTMQRQYQEQNEKIIVDGHTDASKPPPVPTAGASSSPTGHNSNIPVAFPLPSLSRSRLSRTDSRNSTDSYSSYGRQSSQNSSRDWGWFEDVHVTDSANTPTMKRSKQQQHEGPSTTMVGASASTTYSNHAHKASNIASSSPESGNKYVTIATSSSHQGEAASKKGKQDTNKGSKRSGAGGSRGTSLLPSIGLMSGDVYLLSNEREILIHPPADKETGESKSRPSVVVAGFRVRSCFVRSYLSTSCLGGL
jgi:hypothetical protein